MMFFKFSSANPMSFRYLMNPVKDDSFLLIVVSLARLISLPAFLGSVINTSPRLLKWLASSFIASCLFIALIRHNLEYFSFKDGKTDDKNPTTMAEKRYATISLMANELGKFIGSWIKKVKEENKW